MNSFPITTGFWNAIFSMATLDVLAFFLSSFFILGVFVGTILGVVWLIDWMTRD